jgi:hypothetical protein
MFKIWSNNKYINSGTKLKLYNAFIKPILLYNSATLTAAQININKMDIIHRKHLRIIFGIFYPNIVSNSNLYKISNSRPITDEIFISRWKYIGHLLRQSIKHPAFNVMQNFYQQASPNKNYKGRKITLPKQINNDLKLINMKLSNELEFENLYKKALDRVNWKKFTELLYQNYLNHQKILQQKILIKRNNCHANDDSLLKRSRVNKGGKSEEEHHISSTGTRKEKRKRIPLSTPENKKIKAEEEPISRKRTWSIITRLKFEERKRMKAEDKYFSKPHFENIVD